MRASSLAATEDTPRPWRRSDMSSAMITGYPLHASAESFAVPYHELGEPATQGDEPWTDGEAALPEVVVDGHPLTIPLLVSIRYCSGYYEIEHEDLGLFGCGRTQAEAVEDFVSFLMADFRQYALAREEDLDPGARELADTYRRLFGLRQ